MKSRYTSDDQTLFCGGLITIMVSFRRFNTSAVPRLSSTLLFAMTLIWMLMDNDETDADTREASFSAPFDGIVNQRRIGNRKQCFW